ncbi:MAG: hypothetical protein UV51_C0005G0050 [Candidatus Woesebacteria bacterium GW2011_GWC1_42_9]|nr:MAG: hypothetical protein UV51_C0005G0050 [Candidatus Woesebacteria bacterium GW2011_GWC1_42_9]
MINISSVDMSTNAEVVSAQIVLSSFWSPLPEKLPSITEAISSLSDEELAVLNTLSTFTTPLGGAAGELIAAPARENPFSF